LGLGVRVRARVRVRVRVRVRARARARARARVGVRVVHRRARDGLLLPIGEYGRIGQEVDEVSPALLLHGTPRAARREELG
jgi:hypothetical protein